MSRQTPANPRKTASQQRSRATVEALVEATARVLVQNGYEQASTNRIAAVAGVSIGSLYQYFPGKQALIAAVVDRHVEELARVVGDAFVRVASLPIELAMREIVAAAVKAHRVDPRLHRVLDEQVPRTGRREDLEAVVSDACSQFARFLEIRRSEIDVADVNLAAFVVVTTIEALSHSAVLSRPELIAGERAETFLDEATRLVLGFLRASRRDGAASLQRRGLNG
jgi:AcrR family transcriptional regulator